MNWNVTIRDKMGSFLKEIIIWRPTGNGKTEMITSNQTIEIMEHGAYIEPTLLLEQEAFKALVDAIHKDFKPSEGKYTEGKLEATETHLKDLRQLLKLK